MRREISAQTPISLTHLIYEAADSNVERAAALTADVVYEVVRHGAGENDKRFADLLTQIIFAARDRHPRELLG